MSTHRPRETALTRELLAALKALMAIDAVRFGQDEGPDGEGWKSDAYAKALADADRVIAKAEGR